ncbi:MAG: hypothetical protein ACREQ7_25090, partial [Candidatus Binatia bacterium]
ARRNFRVCNKVEHYDNGRLNCGRCEKCVRTMLAFLGAGTLQRGDAFTSAEVSEALVNRAASMSRKTFRYYPELIAPLEQIGRPDLARCISRKLDRYHRGNGWRGKVSRLRNKLADLDRKHLNGSLRLLKGLAPKRGGFLSAHAILESLETPLGKLAILPDFIRGVIL